MASLRRHEWDRIIERIHFGEIIPIISDRVIGDLLPGYQSLPANWADYIEYPFTAEPSIARLAQFLSIDLSSAIEAKSSFLAFAKTNLLDAISDERGERVVVNSIASLRFAEIVRELGYLNFESGQENPLALLAKLPLSTYITTSYYNFLELALTELRRKPQVEICQWYTDIGQPEREETVVIELDPVASKLQEILLASFNMEELQMLMLGMHIDYQDLRHDTRPILVHDLIRYLQRRDRLVEFIKLGREERPNAPWQDIALTLPGLADDDGEEPPTVYHLYGLDSRPESLVLTEHDYLEFFKRITYDKDAKNSFFPYQLRAELRQKPLLLLGYELQDWEFRVLFHGIIAGLRELPNVTGMRWAIQLRAESANDMERADKYLERYFGEHRFSVFWGSSADFVQQLSQRYHEKYG
jgi:hypothetical protein